MAKAAAHHLTAVLAVQASERFGTSPGAVRAGEPVTATHESMPTLGKVERPFTKRHDQLIAD
jgi:hypothetical protein